MSPRREMSSLSTISLQKIAHFVQDVVERVSPKIVKYHYECIHMDVSAKVSLPHTSIQTNDNAVNDNGAGDVIEVHGIDGARKYPLETNSNIGDEEETAEESKKEINYRLVMLTDFVQRLREHIFSHIPHGLIEDVTHKVKLKDLEGSNQPSNIIQ